MAIAMLAAMAARGGYVLGALGIVSGGAIGGYLAWTTRMTAMPQMVALLNGFGGAASVLVAGSALISQEMEVAERVATGLSGLIGSVTFWGSLVAYGKLEEWPSLRRPFRFPHQLWLNAGLAAAAWLFTWGIAGGWGGLYVPLVIVSSVLGVLLVVSIGGADMPVVIALLNSYSGLAGAATGFIINNHVLIVSGALVGASGILLTQLMCRAMNRSWWNVLFGAMDASGTNTTNDAYASVRSTTPEDVAIILEAAQRVVFVPGYGMAVAQAQHAVKALAKKLEERGVTVEFALHPVAGRMPGHMNVLLAEADVSYEQMKEMDEINVSMAQVDVAIVIGANDVVNPLARTDPNCPIAGMPILNVDRARTVIVIKRSLSPGFAGIPNPLFSAPNTLMLFADGQQGVVAVTNALS